MRSKVCSAFILFVLLLSASTYVFADQEPEYEKLPNVIIVTLSGVNDRETLGDEHHQYIPHLWNDIFPKGVLYTNLTDLNYEFHMPVVQAINSGISYPYYSFQIEMPSLFQYFKQQYDVPRTKCWSVGNWAYYDCVYHDHEFDKETYPYQLRSTDFEFNEALNFIADKRERTFVKMFNKLKERKMINWINWDGGGKVQYVLFNKLMREYKPKLVHCVMNAVEIGHYDSYGRYVMALKRSDQYIHELWEYINEDPYYKGRTYLIVNVDHLRNSFYMHHHENTYENPSQVWMYIFGPNIKKGVEIDRKINHVDIFQTVAQILNFKPRETGGRALFDSFEVPE